MTMNSNKIIKIANGQGFWGDSPNAPVDLIDNVNIDYLTLDYLAEVTLSIMQKQKIQIQIILSIGDKNGLTKKKIHYYKNWIKI